MADDGEEEGSYNDTNRAFLQAFMARSTLTFKEAQPVLAAIFTAYGTSCSHFPCSSPYLTTNIGRGP